LSLFSVSEGVILSLEESELGAVDYRYFYLTVLDIDNGFYDKPYFTLVNAELSRPYGALGSLTCGTSTDGIAVYMDVDGDGLKEWTCQSINLLPFAHQGGGAPSPPICNIFAPDETPAIWNATMRAWECGTYNQHLTLALRDDGLPCQTADFLMMFAAQDSILCVDPHNINPADTLSGREVLEERVDIHDDKKWYVIMSDMDMTTSASKTWNNWRWTPFINYDSTSGSSLVPSPPVPLPFASTLIAVTFASFDVTSYTYVILPPSGSDTFTGYVSKLSAPPGVFTETSISSTLVFNSVSATSGQVTFSMTGNAAANCNSMETFVGGVTGRSWAALSSGSSKHLVAITLWIQTSASFTQYF